MSTEALYRLMVWLSPAFPVGAFSYSHGLEWLVETGAVRDEASLCAWVRALVRYGSGWNDAILFSHAFRAPDTGALLRIAELAAAYAAGAERYLETTAQGEAFCDMVRHTWRVPSLEALQQAHDVRVAYPVAVARAVRDHGIDLSVGLIAYLHALTANLVSAGVRLIPLGQTAGQRIIAAMRVDIVDASSKAETADTDELGSALVLGDIASLRHETQYTRLFRS